MTAFNTSSAFWCSGVTFRDVNIAGASPAGTTSYNSILLLYDNLNSYLVTGLSVVNHSTPVSKSSLLQLPPSPPAPRTPPNRGAFRGTCVSYCFHFRVQLVGYFCSAEGVSRCYGYRAKRINVGGMAMAS